jgi:hypothetical protein
MRIFLFFPFIYLFLKINIILNRSEDYDAAGTFTDTLIECSKAYGITINEPKYIEVEGKKPKDWTDTLKSQFFKEC